MAWKERLKKLQELVQAEESEKTQEERQRKESKKLAKRERAQTVAALGVRIASVCKEFAKNVRWEVYWPREEMRLVKKRKEDEIDEIEVTPWPPAESRYWSGTRDFEVWRAYTGDLSLPDFDFCYWSDADDEFEPVQGIMLTTFARYRGDWESFAVSERFIKKCRTIHRNELSRGKRLTTGRYYVKPSLPIPESSETRQLERIAYYIALSDFSEERLAETLAEIVEEKLEKLGGLL